MSEDIFKLMTQSILDGDVDRANELARQSIEQGIDPMDAINQGFIIGIHQVGDDFNTGTAFFPELVIAGAAMTSAMNVLKPEFAKRGTERESLGVVVLATAEGDIHDIGKNLVGTMLAVAGFTVHDLGVDVPIATIIEKASEHNAELVAVSALLTTTMMKQRDVVEAMEDAGMRDSVKVIVGGAPVDQAWVEEIRADGFSKDAVGAVDLAKTLLGKN